MIVQTQDLPSIDHNDNPCNDRYLKKSVIITSQLPVEGWHDRIDDKTHADAILDRMTGQAYRLSLKGASMRQEKISMGEDNMN